MTTLANVRINQLTPEGTDWLRRVLQALDAKDVAAYTRFMADDVEVIFNNGEMSLRGRGRPRGPQPLHDPRRPRRHHPRDGLDRPQRRRRGRIAARLQRPEPPLVRRLIWPGVRPAGTRLERRGRGRHEGGPERTGGQQQSSLQQSSGSITVTSLRCASTVIDAATVPRASTRVNLRWHCQQIEPLGLSQPTGSHHLKVLHAAGLLSLEPRARGVFYRIVPEQLAALRHALAP